ncbi:MAG: RdgB/HAM1 family non-canonical purine NTP pyrophosphatase [Clostridiales bacterium]|jgi:XTP/dITP diphosphohydrolase|nr:RdgB/HAM1 family non-canonical purine NTP pyrophosphatase [Clostridiales bacterium]
MDLLLATNNPHKTAEIKAILKGKFDRVYTLKEKCIDVNPDENGSTFFENAMIKARAVSAYTNLPVLADDSGLSVDFLNGEPGVRSARYAGENASQAECNKKLLDELRRTNNRKARFVCHTVLLFKDGSYISSQGCADGEILRLSVGENGFGYDPLFYSYDLKKTFAEASDAEKNSVSHRAAALAALCRLLK